MQSRTKTVIRGFCSVITKSYVYLLRALARSIAARQPGVRHFVLVLDADTDDELPPPITGEQYVTWPAVIPDLAERCDLAFRYTPIELCAALKVPLAQYVLDHGGCDEVAYLDADMSIHSSLPETAWPSSYGASLVVTPHYVTRQPARRHAITFDGGVFNAGFFAVRGDDHGREIMTYWRELCRRNASFAPVRGEFYDQKWIDLLHVEFTPHIAVCRDHRVNLAWWNLHERPLRKQGDRITVAARGPVGLVHWSFASLAADGKVFKDGLTDWEADIDRGSRWALATLHAEYLAWFEGDFGQSERPPYRFARIASSCTRGALNGSAGVALAARPSSVVNGVYATPSRGT